MTFTNLTSGTTNSSGTSFSTASVSPTANNLILISFSVRNASSTNPADPSVAGCSLTWVKVNSVNFDNNSASRRTLFVYRALGASPSSGAITVTTGETDATVTWSVDQCPGVDTSGTNGSGAVVQSATNFLATGSPNTTVVATLAAFANTNNATFGALANDDGTAWGAAVGSGFSQLGVQGVTGTGLMTEYKAANDTTVDFTFNSQDEIGVIGIEIAAASTPGTPIDIEFNNPNSWTSGVQIRT